MAKSTLVIACDGPARAGKTTLARNFEQKLGIPCLNTGKIYRVLAVLAMEVLGVKELDTVTEEQLLNAIKRINLDKLSINFTGEVRYGTRCFDELMTPPIANAARNVSNIEIIRSSVVEPLVISMVEQCDYPVVVSEGRDEGRLWQTTHHLGLAIFLSVDPVVAAIRERHIRQSLHYDVPSLREITNTLMSYDLSNAQRDFHPTYIAENPVIFTGKVTGDIKRAVANKEQIIVPTSSIDVQTVFKRVVRLADIAKLLTENVDREQISLI